jgi:hypothetical protein
VSGSCQEKGGSLVLTVFFQNAAGSPTPENRQLQADPFPPAAQTGQAPSAGTAVLTPAVTIGGVNATLQYAGVSAGYVGLYQLNAVVPSGVPRAPLFR